MMENKLYNNLRIKIFCRSFDLRLYTLSKGLYETMGFPCVRLTDQSADGYFYTMLKDTECDIAINVDEDCFVCDPSSILRLVDYVVEHGYANAGCPDGGLKGARGQNPIVTNPFFNVFNLKMIREKFSEEAVKKFDYEAHKEELIAAFPKEVLQCDNYTFGKVGFLEPYYQFFFWLAYNFKTLYLPSKKHTDKTTTELFDLEGHCLCKHTWFARFYTMPKIMIKLIHGNMQNQKERIDNIIHEVYALRGMTVPQASISDNLRFFFDRIVRWMIKIPQRVANWPRKIKRKMENRRMGK